MENVKDNYTTRKKIVRIRTTTFIKLFKFRIKKINFD